VVAFQYEDVDELLTMMERWGIAEVHLTVEEASLDLVRALPAMLPHPTPPAQEMPCLPEDKLEREPAIVRAPAVGTFHLAKRGFRHGAPRVCDQVQAGQIIGTIELMHVPNDLISPVSGIIDEILAADGAGVEYGQPLMVIRPYEEVSEDEAGMLPPPAR